MGGRNHRHCNPNWSDSSGQLGLTSVLNRFSLTEARAMGPPLIGFLDLIDRMEVKRMKHIGGVAVLIGEAD